MSRTARWLQPTTTSTVPSARSWCALAICTSASRALASHDLCRPLAAELFHNSILQTTNPSLWSLSTRASSALANASSRRIPLPSIPLPRTFSRGLYQFSASSDTPTISVRSFTAISWDKSLARCVGSLNRKFEAMLTHLYSRPENHGFATHHSEYRRGHVEYQANFDSNIPEMLLRHKHGRHVPRPSRPSPDDAPPIYDDAAAAHDQQYPQEPSRTDLPANRRSNARQATSEDAAKHKIPSGYDLQNWDPDEKPIMVFGSVFDASSLGKWIHDWTVIAHGSFATETDKSSELWSSLMRTAGKLRRSARFISQSVEQGKNAEMVQDLIESGERLMERFQKFLNACEETMYDSDEEDTGDQPEDSGMDFVYAIFSSEKHSAQTDSLMRNMRLWNRRWDENCGVLMGALEPDTEQPTDDGVDSERDSALDVNSSLRNEEYRVVEGPDGEQFRARRATMEDAKQHNIPANYNLQCWDPAERPLLLHQFVFDAMSLGKWIVDCTSYLYGGDSPLTNTAGELWGLLIHLAGKVKLSQQFLSRNRKKSKSVRGTQVIRVVTSSAQRGEHLIQELQQLLQECEQSVTETRDTNAGQLGELSETGSVSFLLSEEGCLGRTEEFMQALRLWISDWDQHVSGILRLFPPNRQSAAG